MQESTTPYVKIEQRRDGGFGDLSPDVEMNVLPRESDALQPEHNTHITWDSIFTLDLESCFVSISIPCHVIGKIGTHIGIGYPTLFALYAFFFAIFNYCYYIFIYANTPVCNKSNLTNWCYFINNEKTCLQSHMQIENDLYLCHYDEKYKVCYGSNEMCLSPNESTIIWCSWAFLEFVSFTVMGCIHLYVRRSLKEKQKVQQDTKCKDILYSFYCSACSLSQQYRAISNDSS
jgi:Cys-rich protein (TIGR01571 family)